MNLITVDALTVHNERTLALDNVSFTVREGEFLTVIGENGAGKSTLVRTILGIQKPDGGSVTLEKSINGKIGYLPQQSEAQRDFPAAVREVVLSGGIGQTGLFPFYSRAQKARAAATMEMLGLAAVANKNYRALSGGQQQRVLLARALCAADKVLLLDEPTTGLDPLVTKELYETVSHLSRSHGMTVLMVSHDLAGVLKYTDRILHLKNRVLFLGTAAEYAKTALGKAFGAGEN
ncbi:MAG: metal ABC transporter ATP-binding protein [Clostridia bacterium]|nr:metal ABC transporter ATP-binding protein [Clostridia bacterium]